MNTTYEEISEAEMAKEMRKRLKKSFNEALEAHENAMKSESAVAKYNSGILRDLEVAFRKDPNVDLFSELPQDYSSAIKELVIDASENEDHPDSILPSSKRVKVNGEDQHDDAVERVPDHLDYLQGLDQPVLQSPLRDSITKLFDHDLSSSNIVQSYDSWEDTD